MSKPIEFRIFTDMKRVAKRDRKGAMPWSVLREHYGEHERSRRVDRPEGAYILVYDRIGSLGFDYQINQHYGAVLIRDWDFVFEYTAYTIQPTQPEQAFMLATMYSKLVLTEEWFMEPIKRDYFLQDDVPYWLIDAY